MKIQRPLVWFAGLGILLALLAIDHWIFITWFNTTHLKWYLTTGASISLVTSIASMAWGDMVEQHTGLISSNPLDYIGSYLQLVGLPIYASGAQLESNKEEKSSVGLLSSILFVLFLDLILTGALILWLVIIVPPQYFVYLICGSPARAMSQSKTRVIARLTGTRLDIKKISSDEKEIPVGWWDASINRKPIAMTNLYAWLLFFIVKSLIG